jgi:hypothetical protein
MLRMAAAQAELIRLLETKLSRLEQQAVSLRSLIDALSASMVSIGSDFPAFHATSLCRLAERHALHAACRTEAEIIRRELIAARSREKALSAKALHLRRNEERKAQEAEALEAALSMGRKACRKAAVLK